MTDIFDEIEAEQAQQSATARDIFDDVADEMAAEKTAPVATQPALDWSPDPLVYSQDDVAKISTPRRKTLAQMYQQTSRFMGEGVGPYHDMTLEMDKYLNANPNARLGDAIANLEEQGYVHPEELPVDLKDPYKLLVDVQRKIASEQSAQEKSDGLSQGIKGVANIAKTVGALVPGLRQGSIAPTKTKYLEDVKSDDLREQARQLRNRYGVDMPGPKDAQAEAAGQIAGNLEQAAKAIDDYKESGAVTGLRAAMNGLSMGMLKLASEGLGKLGSENNREFAEWATPKTPDQQATGGVADLAAFVTPGSIPNAVFKGIEKVAEKGLAKVGAGKLTNTLAGRVAKGVATQAPAMVGTTMLTPQDGILDKTPVQAIKDQVKAGVESAPEAVLWTLGFAGMGELVRGLKTGSLKRDAAVWTVKDQMGVKDPKTAEALVDLIQQKKYSQAADILRGYREPKPVEVKAVEAKPAEVTPTPAEMVKPAEAKSEARKTDVFDEIAPEPAKPSTVTPEPVAEPSVTRVTGANAPVESVPGTIDTGTRINVGDAASAEHGFIDLGKIGGAIKSAAGQVGKVVNFFTGEMAQSVRTRAGKALRRGLDEASNKSASLVGQVDNDAADAYHKLTAADKKWLEQIDGRGYSNMQRLLEDVPSGRVTAPTPGISNWVKVYEHMKQVTGAEAERVGMKRIGKGGQVIDFLRAQSGRMLRNPTPDAQQAMMKQSGPLYEAIADAYARENGITLPQAKDAIREWMGPDSVLKSGTLENARLIKNVPTHVKVGNGWVQILDTDPYQSIVGAAQRQARRIYFVEQFGQNIGGALTKIERLRAMHQKAGGDTTAFDDLISVWNHRPYERVFKNPRSPIARTVKVLDSVAASLQTSLSAIPNLPQTLVQVPRYVGGLKFVKSVAQVLRHPRMTAAQLSAMGGMNRSVMDWTIRAGSVPEDIVRIGKGLLSRGTGLHWIAQFNNMVAGQAFRNMGEHMRLHGVSSGDIRVLKELRLTPKEIAAVKSGNITQDILNKMVQNGIKITQYVTEDAHRMSKFQNIPVLNSLFAYNNYAIGTAKSTGRALADVAGAMAKGTVAQKAAAIKRLTYLLVGSVGAGTASLALRRAAKSQPMVQEGDTPSAMLKDALWEVCLLGPVQRMSDAYSFGGSSKEKAMVNLSPKIKLIADTIFGLGAGMDRYGKLDAATRAKQFAKNEIPVVKAVANLFERAQHPRLAEYDSVRSQVRRYSTDTLKRESSGGDFKINEDFYPIREAFRHFDWDTAKEEVDKYMKDQEAKGIRPKDSILKLRQAINSSRPINLSRGQMQQFLESLPEDKRRKAEEVQQEYEDKMHELLG